MLQQNTAEIIVQQLATWGVKRVYGVAGDANMVFLDALHRHPDIQFVQTRHEGAAALMASAEAKLTGLVGVCTGTNGPGLVNMLNGLADAYADKVPVLAITGQVPSYKLGLPVKQYIDQQVMVQPLVLWSGLLVTPQRAAEMTWLGLHYAQSKGGVTHLSILKDMWQQPGGQVIKGKPPEQKQGEAAGNLVQETAQRLNQAQRPVLMVGRGIREQAETVKTLAERLGAPIVTTLPAKGLLPETFPLSLGGLGQAGTEVAGNILKESDLVLILGATWWPEEYAPEGKAIIQVDAERSNLALTHPAVETITSHLQVFLPALLEKVNKADTSQWLSRVAEERNKWMTRITEERNNTAVPIMPQALMAHLEKKISPEAVIVLDVGDHVIWFDRCYWGSNRDLLISGSWRTMAFGLPAAIAAKLADPNRQVVCITGDGGLTMTLGELLTARRHKAAVKLILINNSSLGMEENRAITAGLTREEYKLDNPDFVQIALACGWEGARANQFGDLDHALEECMKSEKPFLLDVISALPMPPHTKL